MKYEPRSYWTEVAEKIRERGFQNFIAGDDTPFFRYHRARFLKEFSKLDFSNKAVLEVGCGPGGNLAVIHASNPRRLVGCDISPVMIELAQQNLQNEIPDIELAVIDGATLPFGDNSMDITCTVTVLEHNKDEETRNNLIKEICRVTRERVLLFEDTSKRIKAVVCFSDCLPEGKPAHYELA